jgi:hypothetical protein
MDEQDEFDEELIDTGDVPDDALDEVADEDEEDYGDDDNGGGDDGEPAEFRAALLAKQEMIALISLRTVAGGGRIVRIDPRQAMPAAKSYEDPAEAERWFRRSLVTSQRNGWRVVYDGEPLFG